MEVKRQFRIQLFQILYSVQWCQFSNYSTAEKNDTIFYVFIILDKTGHAEMMCYQASVTVHTGINVLKSLNDSSRGNKCVTKTQWQFTRE